MTHKSLMQRFSAFDAAVYLIMFFVLSVLMYPLWYVLMASVSDVARVYENPLLLLPRGFNLLSYDRIIQNSDIWSSYKNTLLYTVAGVTINIIMTVLGGYALSRSDFYGRNVFTFIMVFTMFFNGGLIPTYLIIKNMRLLNTFWVMVIPNAIATYYVILARTFFQTRIPHELQESAKIDGCANFRMLVKVVLPLSIPFISVIVLFYAMAHWNSYFQALIYLNDRKRWPLQLLLREILVQAQMDNMQEAFIYEGLSDRVMVREGLKYSTVVVASVPLLVVYPFLQRFFKEGILVGALKG